MYIVTMNIKRLGTMSLIAGIDLLSTGIAIPVVSETTLKFRFHLSLKKLDEMYPEGDVIRIIQEQPFCNTNQRKCRIIWLQSQKDVTYLCLHQKHASWLNLIECFLQQNDKTDVERNTSQIKAGTGGQNLSIFR